MRAADFLIENIELRHEPTSTGGVEIHAYRDGQEVGWVRFQKLRTGQFKAAMVHVPERLRRQGVGTAMYQYARQELGLDIVPSDNQTEYGRAFWNKVHEDSEFVTERKKRQRRNRSVGGYWYPGYGYYGSGAIGGESGDGGGDGGGGESLKEAKVLKLNDYNQWLNQVAAQQGSDKQMASSKIIQGIDKSGSKIGEFDSSTNQGWVMQQIDENNLSESANNVIFISNDTAIVGQEHGKRLQLSDQEVKRVQDIAQRHGAWYEGNGMDSKLTAGIIDDYAGSWDDDLLSPAIKGYPAPFLYVLFSNIKENDTVEGKIGFDPDSTIFDRILDTQPSTNYFPDREFDAETLQKFLKSVSEGPYDFVRMSQAPATESNVRKFFTMGEQLMFPDNWAEYPYRAGRVAKSVNDLRDRFLATRKAGVYVAGSDHLQAVQQFLDQNKQGVAEGLPQTLRKVVPGYAKREIDKKMDAEKFGRTDVDRDANYYRYKKIQDKIKEQGMAENFADGKIKGKSRPGRVKRAGASCNGSVTDLRKRAKNASGERAKMYHWCANMKSGRKK